MVIFTNFYKKSLPKSEIILFYKHTLKLGKSVCFFLTMIVENCNLKVERSERMFCGECGAQNKKEDTFCSECGAPLVQEEKQENATNVAKKPRQPMSKKNKIIIIVVLAVAILLGVGYKIGSDATNPKAVAKEYIQAVIDQDGNKLYQYLELEGDKTFVSKKIFTDLLGGNKSESNIVNYTITDVTYGDGKLSAIVNFKYTTKGSSSERTDSVHLTKQKDKKFLIFDNWEVSDISAENMVVEDYTIEVPKGATLTYAGIAVDKKYLDSEQATLAYDVYVLPQVFTTATTLKATLANGLELEEQVTPSSYYKIYTVSFDEDSLSEATKEKITGKAKEALTTIYTNAISKKQFSDIKSNFEHGDLDLSKLETSYNTLVSDLGESSNTLTSIEFTEISIYDVTLNDNSEFEVELKASYDYTVNYTNWSDEVETHSDSDYSYITVVLAYDQGEYYLTDVEDLDSYFSRY